jgi:hypothetical protein
MASTPCTRQGLRLVKHESTLTKMMLCCPASVSCKAACKDHRKVELHVGCSPCEMASHIMPSSLHSPPSLLMTSTPCTRQVGENTTRLMSVLVDVNAAYCAEEYQPGSAFC